ncbi:MAG: DUF86 domain-containing protein [Deltaproteobacteria bacterium]|nr:DUF86 domain-containing protein [Deltaproteobacteria bacterium]
MVNRELVLDRLSRVREYVKHLKELVKLSPKEFVSDFKAVSSAERLLQISIEACLDVGNHIISRCGLERPREYKDIFIILGKEGVLPYVFAEKLIPMVKFRNRLVHLYFEINKEELYNIIQTNLHDIEEFVQYIVNYIEEKKGSL